MLENPAAEAQVTKRANSDSRDARGVGRLGLPGVGAGLGAPSLACLPGPPFRGERPGRVERCEQAVRWASASALLQNDRYNSYIIGDVLKNSVPHSDQEFNCVTAWSQRSKQ